MLPQPRRVSLSPTNKTYIGNSKRGDAVLRRAFYLVTLTSIKVNLVIKRFYEDHKVGLGVRS
jgi:transposase